MFIILTEARGAILEHPEWVLLPRLRIPSTYIYRSIANLWGHTVDVQDVVDLGGSIPNSSNVCTMRSTFSKNALVDNRANLIVNVDSFLTHYSIPVSVQVKKKKKERRRGRYERDESGTLDVQDPFDGVRLELSIDFESLFRDPRVSL